MIARVDFFTFVILQIPCGSKSYWEWWLDDPTRQRQYPVSLLTIGISCIIGNCTSLTHILDISCTSVTRPEKLTGEKKLADLSSALPVDRKKTWQLLSTTPGFTQKPTTTGKKGSSQMERGRQVALQVNWLLQSLCTVGQPKFWGILESNSTIEFDPKPDGILFFGSLGCRFTSTGEVWSSPFWG